MYKRKSVGDIIKYVNRLNLSVKSIDKTMSNMMTVLERELELAEFRRRQVDSFRRHLTEAIVVLKADLEYLKIVLQGKDLHTEQAELWMWITEAQAMLAELHLQVQDDPEATMIVTELSQNDKTKLQALVTLGNLHLSSHSPKDVQGAAKELKEVIVVSSKEAQAVVTASGSTPKGTRIDRPIKSRA